MSFFSGEDFTYDEPNDQYLFSYKYTTGLENFTINASINNTSVGSLSDQTIGTFNITRASYPVLFSQGVSLVAQLTCPEDDVESTPLYGIFLNANDSRNIYLGSNPTYITYFTNTNSNKSVILPPKNQTNNQTFAFKYLETQSNAYIVSYINNISYPILNNTYIPTDSTFSGYYDYIFNSGDGNYGRIELTPAANNACLSYITNTEAWILNNVYLPNPDINIFSTAPIGNIVTDSSNSAVLYYRCTNATSNIIQLATIPENQRKYVYIQNNSGAGNLSSIITTSYGIEGSLSTNIWIGIPENESRAISFIRKNIDSQEKLFIYSYYNVKDLYPVSWSDTFTTISSPNIFLSSSTEINLSLQNPITKPGVIRLNTMIPTSGSLSTMQTFENTASKYFAIGGDTTVKAVHMSTSGYYTFGSLYLNENSNQVILPLAGPTLPS